MNQTRSKPFRIPKLTRDAGIYLLGIFILLHETLIGNGDRPTLIYAACALLGLPIVMRVDEFRNRGNGEEEDEPEPVKPAPRKATPRPRKSAG